MATVAHMSYCSSFAIVKKFDQMSTIDSELSQSSKLFKVLFYDSKRYDRDSFDKVVFSNKYRNIQLLYVEPRLDIHTAQLCKGCQAVCIFVNDLADEQVIDMLYRFGVKLIALRCAGFNNVNLKQAQKRGIIIVRVPAYSPYGVAEYSIGLLMSMNRKIHVAYGRVKFYDFSVGQLVGFTMHGKTVGVIGTGKIGKCAISILKGMGVLAFDVFEDKEAKHSLGFDYCSLDRIYLESRVIMLFAPLNEETNHMINAKTIEKMTDGVIIVNTSRGALIDTKDLIKGIQSGKVGGAALDVYENEQEYFFRDMSDDFIDDNELATLLKMDNVIVTSHHAYLTEEALFQISTVTLENIIAFIGKQELANEVTID